MGKIIMPHTGKRPQRGKVVAVAKNGGEVKAGEMVLFGKSPATEIRLDGVTHFVLDEDDLFVVIE